MTIEAGANYGLTSGYPYGADTWSDAINLNWRTLDGTIQFSTPVAALNTPPSSPARGNRYLIGATPTGLWAGQANKLTVWDDDEFNVDAWRFYAPNEGWFIHVLDVTTTVLPVTLMYRGGAWRTKSEVASIAGLTGALTMADLIAGAFGSIIDQDIPAPGLVISTGTVIATATLGAHVTLVAGSTLDVVNLATMDLAGSNIGRVPFSMLPVELENAPLSVSWDGTLTATSRVLYAAFGQDGVLPSGMPNCAIVFDGGTADYPAGTMSLPVSTWAAGTWTTRGTISVNSGATLSIVGGPTADVALTAPWAIKVVNVATPDTGAKNFALTVFTKKKA